MSDTSIIPPRRNKRLFWIIGLGLMLVGGLYLVFQALGETTQYFYNPADVVAPDFVPESEIFKIGGLVSVGTIENIGDATIRFGVEDFERPMAAPIQVTYRGAVPDLFREGQGVVVAGRLLTPLEFQATELFAKHDENYQPEIAYKTDK